MRLGFVEPRRRGLGFAQLGLGLVTAVLGLASLAVQGLTAFSALALLTAAFMLLTAWAMLGPER